MPIIEVKRQGVRPFLRKVPTSTCAIPMPMTLDRVGSEVGSANEEPTTLESAQDAFDKFKPTLKFKGRIGEDQTEFQSEFHFRKVGDFDPKNLLSRQEVKNPDGSISYLRNDLADLKASIDLLYRLKDRWMLAAVRRAWANPDQRQEIINAIKGLMGELSKVAGGKS